MAARFQSGSSDFLSCALTDRVTFLPGAPRNLTIGVNETVQAAVPGVPVDVAFATLQFHTQDHNATLSYNRVSRRRRRPWRSAQIANWFLFHLIL